MHGSHQELLPLSEVILGPGVVPLAQGLYECVELGQRVGRPPNLLEHHVHFHVRVLDLEYVLQHRMEGTEWEAVGAGLAL